jgi:hypothetical protein
MAGLRTVSLLVHDSQLLTELANCQFLDTALIEVRAADRDVAGAVPIENSIRTFRLPVVLGQTPH